MVTRKFGEVPEYRFDGESVSHSVVSNTLQPMGCSPTGSVHGILQARILEWVTILFSPGDLPSPGTKPSSLDSTFPTKGTAHHISGNSRIVPISDMLQPVTRVS